MAAQVSASSLLSPPSPSLSTAQKDASPKDRQRCGCALCGSSS
eukprot:CAMPEP_0177419744 /NCGR_PEP_ID=MMETSP0368-20130122/69891_1 /TAXON_ID=447022 ORGANISM="Scrippsiella hangoei-like, Strain SHHI-4" /NCGR_SAMPLE_ID=MMETSP0368 /ASSEMBLY_ACC=CAM_ASM_000363 /LENGTH=42 /DNA_ID= /DNA_START= /DNA_END= /DNA_ORIENTATION=